MFAKLFLSFLKYKNVMSMHVHMGDVSSLVPLYMISSYTYYGDQVMHILWWLVCGPLVTGVN